MRIFVTGASGFIGRHLVPLLVEDGHELLILTRQPIYNSQTLVGDLRDLNQIEEKIVRFNPEVCVHLAWEGLPDYSYERSLLNLNQSMNLIHLLVHKTACRKIIVSGSSWEYGKTKGVCREDDPATVTSYFTWAKNALQTGGAFLCSQHGVEFVWLRLFFTFGPGQKKQSLIPTLYEAFKKGTAAEIKTPFNAQDFIYVEDVAQAFQLAVQKEIKSGAYNVGRSEPVTVADIYTMVGNKMKKSLKPFEKTGEATVCTWADTAQFRAATGWSPQTDLQEGIQRHLDFMETT